MNNENATGKAHFLWGWVGLCYEMSCLYQNQKEGKTLVAKWDSIKKHVSKKKVSNAKWIMDPKCMHIKNEISYAQLLQPLSFKS